MFSNVSTGPPAAPSNLTQSYSNLTTITITWDCAGIDVTYTVTSTSLMSPFPGILQESFVLRHLKVETDYIVSVTATNVCGDESQPSENITVRIDDPGMLLVCMYISLLLTINLCKHSGLSVLHGIILHKTR